MAESVASLTARLAEVDAAITAVLAGQSYSLNGRALTRASYAELRDERRRLQQALDLATDAASDINSRYARTRIIGAGRL